jgi:hypothetical protein
VKEYDVMDHVPSDEHRGFRVPVGVSINGLVVWGNVAGFSHVLIWFQDD